jgi:hypothetical protein
MISCTEFIPAYNELFRFFEEKGGRQAVLDFWAYLSDAFLTNLKDHVLEKGLEGCWDYWSRTLDEEAADFTMELDTGAGTFSIDMHHCPSKGRLLEDDRVDPRPGYCAHCDLLYRRVLEPMGYEYDLDRSETDHARCRLTVKKMT